MRNQKSNILGDPNLGIYSAAVTQYRKRDIRNINFNVALSFAQLVKGMFGPKGLSKMLITPNQELKLTRKGYKVIKFIQSRLPITTILRDMVETQEEICGDGTKSVILLTVFLLEKAKKLLDLGISPQTINEGLFLSTRKALEVLESSTIEINYKNEEYLRSLIDCVMVNRLSSQDRQFFIDLTLDAIKTNNLMGADIKDFDPTNIIFRKLAGKSVSESKFVNGMIIYKDRPNTKVPVRINNPKLLLIRRNIDFFVSDNLKNPREIDIKDSSEYSNFLQFNMSYYENIAKNIKNRGINAIFCQKKVNKYFIDYCASLGIIALELVGEEELKKLSEITNATIISDLNVFLDEDIGIADLIEFKKITNDEMLFIYVNKSRVLTFLLRGGMKYIVEELEEVLETAFKVSIQTLKDQKILPGGGALECEIAHALKTYSKTFHDRLQYVIEEFGKAFENIPAFIILNSSADPLDLIPSLRKAHANGQIYDGFDCTSHSLVNVVNHGIFDGYKAKKHQIKIASEVARQIIRIDKMIMVTNPELQKELDASTKASKAQKHDKRLRRYFKDKEEEMFTP